MVHVNKQRIPRSRQDYKKDPSAFIKSEKERVDGFMPWYRYTLGGGMVLILVGLGLFRLWGGNHGRAIGLAVILAGFSLLLIDHISQHNALTYQGEINKALKSRRHDSRCLLDTGLASRSAPSVSSSAPQDSEDRC